MGYACMVVLPFPVTWLADGSIGWSQSSSVSASRAGLLRGIQGIRYDHSRSHQRARELIIYVGGTVQVRCLAMISLSYDAAGDPRRVGQA